MERGVAEGRGSWFAVTAELVCHKLKKTTVSSLRFYAFPNFLELSQTFSTFFCLLLLGTGI